MTVPKLQRDLVALSLLLKPDPPTEKKGK